MKVFRETFGSQTAYSPEDIRSYKDKQIGWKAALCEVYRQLDKIYPDIVSYGVIIDIVKKWILEECEELDK